MRTRCPRLLPCFSYRGLHRYFITWCCDARKQLFRDTDTVSLVTSQIQRASIACGMSIVAYCFMPDHVHLLLEGQRDDSDLRQFLRLAKQLSGYAYSRRHRTRLWQRYTCEHVLRDDESTRRAVRYILENPVRAGLVRTVHDYPFVGAGERTRAELIVWAYADGDG